MLALRRVHVCACVSECRNAFWETLQLPLGSRGVVHLCQHRQECSAHSAFYMNILTESVSFLAARESSWHGYMSF